MSKSELIARHSAHPRGPLGQIVARLMALDTAAVNRHVLKALEPKPGERILELGCGHGRSLRRVADALQRAGFCDVEITIETRSRLRVAHAHAHS